MQKDSKNSLRDTAYLKAVNNGDMETAHSVWLIKQQKEDRGR